MKVMKGSSYVASGIFKKSAKRLECLSVDENSVLRMKDVKC